MGTYTNISHTADVKLHIYGETREDLFQTALQAMVAVSYPGLLSSNVTKGSTCSRTIHVYGTDGEFLLVDFLNDVLAYTAVYHEIYSSIAIETLTEKSITGTLACMPASAVADAIVEIKAVTFHDFFVTHDATGWAAELVFDI